MTRFADLGFLIGILVYGYYAGTFSFTPDARLLASAGVMIPLALGLMFVGGAGKSAMFPLHIWLPDAMEGPTPVSALIHAATMVVAGVYLVARMFPLFVGYAPEVLHWTAYVGAFTALYAAAVACVQSDIKRVLAFSTISQIGFMIVALGVCTSADPHAGGLGYMASMFHLFTHAMFKALLFLGAGCIIHAVHSNEMSAMGGLRRYMPLTHVTFLVACLAIAGIWPLSGFFSKDEILTACFAFSPVMGWVMTLIAGMTAFYMFRSTTASSGAARTASSTPPTRRTRPPDDDPAAGGARRRDARRGLAPLRTLRLLQRHVVRHPHRGERRRAEPLRGPRGHRAGHLDVRPREAARGRPPGRRFAGLHRAAYHRFYIDEVYQFITHRIIFGCISTPIAWFDRHVVDGFLNLLATATQSASWAIREMQSGSVQRYCIWFLGGAMGFTLLLLLIC